MFPIVSTVHDTLRLVVFLSSRPRRRACISPRRFGESGEPPRSSTMQESTHAVHVQDGLQPPPNGLLGVGFPYKPRRRLRAVRTGWALPTFIRAAQSGRAPKPAGSRLSKLGRSLALMMGDQQDARGKGSAET